MNTSYERYQSNMKSHQLLLAVLSGLCILPFFWSLFNIVTGYSFSDRSYGGVNILWGVIGFFLSFLCVFFIKKLNKANHYPANVGLELLYQIYISIAVILIFLGILLLILIIIISTGPGFQL